MKVSIVYWSGTGNTEAMAEAALEGAKNAGAEVQLLPVATADESVLQSDILLLGCPAMGSEELEESEFEPFFSSIEGKLAGKKVGLFGSYDWGDGEWMRSPPASPWAKRRQRNNFWYCYMNSSFYIVSCGKFWRFLFTFLLK